MIKAISTLWQQVKCKNINILILVLIVAYLSSILLTNYKEIFIFLAGYNFPGMQEKTATPLYIKGIKDLLIIILASIMFFKTMLRNIKLPVLFWAFLFCYLLSLIYSMVHNSPITILSSLRAYFPLLLLPLCINTVSKTYQYYIYLTLRVLFYIGLFLQLGGLFLASGYYGLYFNMFSSRNPGLYLIPSSMASFSMVYLYYSLFFSKQKKNFFELLGAIPLSIFLTGSGTGFLSYFFYIVSSYLPYAILACVILFFPFIFVIIYFMLPAISGRDDIWDSLWGRFPILERAIDNNAIFFSKNVAFGTNNAALLSQNFTHLKNAVGATVNDSTWIAIMNSAGIAGAIFFTLFYFQAVFTKRSQKTWIFFLCSFPFMSTILIFELHPIGFLMTWNLAELIKEADEEKR